MTGAKGVTSDWAAGLGGPVEGAQSEWPTIGYLMRSITPDTYVVALARKESIYAVYIYLMNWTVALGTPSVTQKTQIFHKFYVKNLFKAK